MSPGRMISPERSHGDSALEFSVLGLGCGFWGLSFWVWVFGFWVRVSGVRNVKCKVLGSGFGFLGLGIRVWGLKFRVSSLGVHRFVAEGGSIEACLP